MKRRSMCCDFVWCSLSFRSKGILYLFLILRRGVTLIIKRLKTCSSKQHKINKWVYWTLDTASFQMPWTILKQRSIWTKMLSHHIYNENNRWVYFRISGSSAFHQVKYIQKIYSIIHFILLIHFMSSYLVI